jgi:tetratricopeptide (TPR) repeat protein
MNRTRLVAAWALAAIALGAVAAWPWYVRAGADAARAAAGPPPAVAGTDYRDRERRIAFWERAVTEHHRGDMMSPATLSSEYLQRYRERGDIGDVVRALHDAWLSLRAQPYGNESAEVGLASALLTLHRFKDALAVTRHLERYEPGDPAMKIREASLDLELGRYGAAGRIVAALERKPNAGPDAIGANTLLTRYDELTGHLARARERFARVTALEDSLYDEPAQQRAWVFFRSGELAFEAGDNDAAVAAERTALERFPNYSEANRVLARVDCALHRWQDCLDAAKASAAVIPYPEVLGYEVDALRALGNANAAAQTDDLIRTVERIGNAQHISDRLLAIYYSEHGEHLDDAYAIARRELNVRDDVFTEDTLAWAAAMDGRWSEARRASARALRYGTENALLQYHAGIIARHFGDRAAAKGRLGLALALNPQFHPFYADDARAKLASL